MSSELGENQEGLLSWEPSEDCVSRKRKRLAVSVAVESGQVQ